MPSPPTSPRPGQVRIGISGWTYPPWRGTFYPKGLRQKDELDYAASRFRSIEINGTFYGTQRPTAFADWAARTPRDFVFAVKAPRYITHILRLRDAETALANFFASGPLRLGTKLGPLLWQLPPSFKYDPDRIESFLKLLPHTTTDAAKLATHHDHRMDGRAFTEAGPHRKLRHALEIRHESFRDPAFVKLLRAHHVALVCADTVDWPRLMDVTADFVYVRLHGAEELYASGYDDDALDAWAARVTAWARGGEPASPERADGPAQKQARRDVFVYFDNDIKVRAPRDAAALAERVARQINE
ncbi:MAG: DUF72 domain-containing protein [Proteobacteria bacterium]|nr:DUF72 domain-containing protein [Pseudomonadota bacterium]